MSDACPQARCLVAAGLGPRILAPSDREYTARQDSYWSNSAKLQPACIVCPRSTAEVAAAVKALAQAGQPFAIRSGGHTNWTGSNNIDGGVTLDLGLLDGIEYDSRSETATLGPGARWLDVCRELQKHGRAVAGGREGNVGVGGLTLGGGNTYFTGRRGWACHSVVAYEVLLADGRVITADSDNHADLFRALKGGSNNFGVVTRFTMAAVPCDRIWAGMAFLPRRTIPQVIDAVADFTDRVPEDPDSNAICIITYLPDFRDVVVANMYVQVAGVERAPAFDRLLAIRPEMMNGTKMTTLPDLLAEYNVPDGRYTTWFTMSFKNDARIMAKASKLHDKLVEELLDVIPEGDFTTQCLFQPLPRLYAQRSVEAGGNVMGLERHAHDGILFLAVTMVKTPEQEAFAHSRVESWIRGVREFAETIDGGVLDWVYLNYADRNQDVIGSYGEENVRKIRDAARKYDPQGVFQRLCPGGFKISGSDRGSKQARGSFSFHRDKNSNDESDN